MCVLCASEAEPTEESPELAQVLRSTKAKQVMEPVTSDEYQTKTVKDGPVLSESSGSSPPTNLFAPPPSFGADPDGAEVDFAKACGLAQSAPPRVEFTKDDMEKIFMQGTTVKTTKAAKKKDVPSW